MIYRLSGSNWYIPVVCGMIELTQTRFEVCMRQRHDLLLIGVCIGCDIICTVFINGYMLIEYQAVIIPHNIKSDVST